MNSSVLTVSALNFYIKNKFDEDANLNNVFVEGEISNFKRHFASGHLYFSLKDSGSAIRCVMFSGAASRLKFEPQNDMKVIVSGRISVYEKEGQYQIYCFDLQPFGAGALSIAYEQLKQKLTKEGLFAPEHKKPIPMYPRAIAVLTSETGAAVNDIITTVNRRNPTVGIIVCPVLVQGDGAAESIINMLNKIEDADGIDTVILGRGGGSFEDLFCFNDESLVRRIYRFKLPIISAVGHENDYTFCDFVSDLRAPTPTAAAELAVPDIKQAAENVNALLFRIRNIVRSKLENASILLDRCLDSLVFKDRKYILRMQVDSYKKLVNTVFMSANNDITKRNEELGELISKLEALNPLKVLSRGYAVVSKDNNIIKSKNDIQVGDTVSVVINDGTVKCEVLSKE